MCIILSQATPLYFTRSWGFNCFTSSTCCIYSWNILESLTQSLEIAGTTRLTPVVDLWSNIFAMEHDSCKNTAFSYCFLYINVVILLSVLLLLSESGFLLSRPLPYLSITWLVFLSFIWREAPNFLLHDINCFIAWYWKHQDQQTDWQKYEHCMHRSMQCNDYYQTHTHTRCGEIISLGSWTNEWTI